MPINEALFAAMKAASYIKPNAGKSYKLQRVAEELIAKQAPANPKCRVEDISAPMADGYAVPLRVFTPLVAYGAPLPEALEESSANDTPVASAISAILPAVLPKVLPKIPIKESTSSGNTGSIPDDSGTEIPVITPHGTILFFHGGGWATGGINLYTQACAHMAVRLQRRVIAVEYRLAPEYRFPTAVEDCYEAARQLFAGGCRFLGWVEVLPLMATPSRLCRQPLPAGAIFLRTRETFPPAGAICLTPLPIPTASCCLATARAAILRPPSRSWPATAASSCRARRCCFTR